MVFVIVFAGREERTNSGDGSWFQAPLPRLILRP